jgi:hypothetical protein|nr:MAG TPA: hypothetical protein [Caudoviricetes sp.]
MTQQLITRILCEILFEKTSEELNKLVLDLQINDEPLAEFCDRFELGNWFYDQMTLADIDIIDEIAVIADEHHKAERSELRESEILRRELQEQGAL